ncbi:MAG: glycosyltransferase family 2 protein [Jatrophihabitans sp.]|uniref:glycosyltransferase family 2 protein n=1 Tax=Jatrophihabitans sp. TaxID=1932789 RepID=UPI003F7D2A9B
MSDLVASVRARLPESPPYPPLALVRPLVAITTLLGLNYVIWRWTSSVNWAAWFIAVPLVIAETYSLLDSLLFGMTVWRLKRRPDPGPPPPGATVDVFITTYNEDIDLVMQTARAAKDITYPHRTVILDDGNRAELRAIAEAEGIDVVSRSADWVNMPRHAKAGNLNNALMVTHGEFIAILDADQVPAPEFLDHVLGYFNDPKMAIVQTPQFFLNVPDSDPLGSQAPLFYGPLQQGKDGWNAAFFCGSNAVLRREALLQMGIRRYVQELEQRIDDALSTAQRVIRKARRGLGSDDASLDHALTGIAAATDGVKAALADGTPLGLATAAFQRRVREIARELVNAHLSTAADDLAEIAAIAGGDVPPPAPLDSAALEFLSHRDESPLAAFATVHALITSLDVDRDDEAQAIMPMSTISVTEDMATCMRLHSMGWKSAYHDEILVVGLAPEDVQTMLTQRLRWAQGTIQVALRENPWLQKGLSIPQKLMYTGTIWSYLSGFAALAYIAAPILYLVFGVLPVNAISTAFFLRLAPFLLLNQLLFFVIGRGRRTFRGQQYSLALFPVWIRSVTSAVGNVVFGRSLTFAVTPKTKQQQERPPWHLVKPQLIAMGLLVVAVAIGLVRYGAGQATGLATGLNVLWVGFDLVLFSVIPRAVLYRGYQPDPEPSDRSQAAATRPMTPFEESMP